MGGVIEYIKRDLFAFLIKKKISDINELISQSDKFLKELKKDLTISSWTTNKKDDHIIITVYHTQKSVLKSENHSDSMRINLSDIKEFKRDKKIRDILK